MRSVAVGLRGVGEAVVVPEEGVPVVGVGGVEVLPVGPPAAMAGL